MIVAIVLGVLLAACVLGPFMHETTRRRLVSARLLELFRRLMPRVSATERAAIEAGTVWWDAELFGGRPDWDRLLATPCASLTSEERAFLDNETQALCDLANDWQSSTVWQDLPPQAWDYVKAHGFLGLIIPRAYGGKQFSAAAHSAIVTKLATRCSAAAVSVMVPNSLGPAELLLHYGTDTQKAHYLPRLARGDEIPCFALTNPYAGSDAAAMEDVGIVCRRTWQGRETLGFIVSWDKRYITLAPIATVLGLAFRVRDPDGLLGRGAEPGITCALIAADHPGVEIGRRHWPLNAVFQNGPTRGRDVFVPIDAVIGGEAQVGQGWRMLMECLAAGRAISLPASATGAAKLAAHATGAYAAIRRQFNVPIGQFEAVAEPLGRIGGHTYAMDACRTLSAAAIDAGEKPSVISAISKYHITERARLVINDAMDVVGGKGICMGPGNFLARAYQQAPIAITVEGANIMTRALIIFGQGAIRCHPFVLPMMRAAAEQGDAGLAAFDRAFFGYVDHVAGNLLRVVADALTFGRLRRAPRDTAPALAGAYQHASRLSSVLALASDVAMASLGGGLKRRESVTARLGDVLSQLYIVSAVLKRFEDDGRPEADLPMALWAVEDGFERAHTAIRELCRNFPLPVVGIMLRVLAFPFGVPRRPPTDRRTASVASILLTPSAARERLVSGRWQPRIEVDGLASIDLAFEAYQGVALIERRLRRAVGTGRIARMPQALPLVGAWADQALGAGLITPDERAVIGQFVRHAEAVIAVDDFAPDFDAAADGEARLARIEPAMRAAE